MADTADGGMTREELTLSLGEGISAHALIKALVSSLKDKGILTDADIEQIEQRPRRNLRRTYRSSAKRVWAHRARMV
jgi:phytoene dehydrogenase-like protein